MAGLDQLAVQSFNSGMECGRDNERKRILYEVQDLKEQCAYWNAIKHDWPEDHDARCDKCRPLNHLITFILEGQVNA
jgi:hypothetical protein